MKAFVHVALILTLLLVVGNTVAEELSEERQREIIENFMYVTGQSVGSGTVAADDHDHDRPAGVKCGTPAILEFYRNYDRLDRTILEALGVEVIERPNLALSYDTPGGNIKIHYDATGSKAVWEATVDNNGNGVPDFVEAVGRIADSAWNYIFVTSGYVLPVSDTVAENDGGDGRVDVYLEGLPNQYYGLTYPAVETSPTQAFPAFVVIDNDYLHLEGYDGRPLDAVRVTLAHELFHTSHFAMDYTEAIDWMEMTAVWMEEQQYDDINDYYNYCRYFYNLPGRSLQSTMVLHHYAAAVWPIYLSEKYDAGVIKAIWERAAINPFPSYLLATEQVIDSVSDGAADFHTAFNEFAVWNFFTGPYAHQAPEGIGFSEAANYLSFPYETMDVQRNYPFTSLVQDDNPNWPEYNAAMYIRLENLQAIETDSTLAGAFYIPESVPGDRWSFNVIYQSEDDPDLHVMGPDTLPTTFEMENTFLYLPFSDVIDSLYRGDYQSATIVVTSTTIAPGLYSAGNLNGIGYWVNDSSFVDPHMVNVPAGVLEPYPNPAVVGEMSGADLTFRFQLATDTTGLPVLDDAFLLLDLFTIAGERINTLEGRFVGEDRTGIHRKGIYEVGWNMKNESGKDVASGAYLGWARLFESSEKRSLLAEDRVKVAVIR